MATVHITLNGKKIKADTDQSILDVARNNGVFIPTLCHDERLEPLGSCRVCLVKVEEAKSFVPACSTKVTDGMIVDTEDQGVHEARRLSLALLISDHYGDCVSPCSLECPAHIDIQGYIALIRAGKYQEAVKLIKEKNPMPLTIGRICPHPCETVCRRSKVEDPIAINNLKRFTADYDSALEVPYVPVKEDKKNHRIAIIGSGPAGLSAAYYLAVKGYDVSIFEKNSKAGGMLRYGIPDYRLPKDILDREIGFIQTLGVNIHYNKEMGKDFTIEDLKKDGYTAVFLGIGAQNSINLRIEGEDHANVIGGLELLHDIATGKTFDFSAKTVVIVGGGNTAMDAARTSLRLGAKNVKILYRRTRKEMPANDIEIEEAEEEGIQFEFLAAPIRITDRNGHLQVECIRMELGKPDASGRRRPIPIEGSNYTTQTHYLISAIGQRTDLSGITDPQLVSSRDTIKANTATGTTHSDFIFSGGDCVTGAATAIEAIAGGRKAALSIDKYLRTGSKPEGDPFEFNISKGELDEIPDAYYDLYEKDRRAVMPVQKVEERIKDFREIELGLPVNEAVREAARCLECGCSEGFSCLLRDHSTTYRVNTSEFPGEKNHYPEYNNLISKHPPILRDENKCIKCGICVRICDEVWGLNIFGYSNRGFQTEIAPYFGLNLKDTECDFCGQCADSCPTGALSINTYFPKPGPFKAEKISGICINCNLGCELEYNVYENAILRTTAAALTSENEGNLCVRGRFGFSYLAPPKRSTHFMEFSDGSCSVLRREQAFQTAVDILKASTKTAVVTSTHLSNEEYEHLYELADIKKGMDIFHVPYDFAEYRPKTTSLVGKSGAFENILNNNTPPSLSDITDSDAVLLFNISPGRSYPILEMKCRNAAKAGTNLFIINEKAIRLDDYAQSTFRIKRSLYKDFLHFAASLAYHNNDTKPSEVKKYFKDLSIDSSILLKAEVSLKKMKEFLACFSRSKSPIFITDEDMTAQDELEAFLMTVLTLNKNGMLLMMQRGTNPGGAKKYMTKAPEVFSLSKDELNDYDTLIFYKIPDLFGPYQLPIIHIGFTPFASYGKKGIFIPSSSLLETSGTTYLYNGRKAILEGILKNIHGLDNIDSLTNIIGKLKKCMKEQSF